MAKVTWRFRPDCGHDEEIVLEIEGDTPAEAAAQLIWIRDSMFGAVQDMADGFTAAEISKNIIEFCAEREAA